MTRTHGFTLIELAIVIVIIGLLAGGVLVGRDMIRAAELRSITTEYEKYVAAVNVFKDKYLGLPGDLKNATAFWGAAHATPATCLTTVGTGTQTCNGDGDGAVDISIAASQYGEGFTFWQHLANAGLIEGRYTGIAGAGGALDSNTATNVPSGRVSGSGWTAAYAPGPAGFGYTTDYGNHFQFGSRVTNSFYYGAIINPQEAYDIDTKIDDGRPGSGTLWARYINGACSDATSDTDYDSAYVLTKTTIECALLFKQAF